MILRVALRALGANKLRTALTMLGIVIGVAAVIALMSVGRGAQSAITERIQGMGTNLLFVRPGRTSDAGVRSNLGTAATLTYEDAMAMLDPICCPAVAKVAPEVGAFVQIIAGGQNVGTRVVGTSADYPDVRNFQVADGEFLTRQQVEAGSSVLTLGANVAETLFPDGSAVGQTVAVAMGPRRLNFRVIGVMERKGSQAMGNQDDVVLMPLSTLQRRIFNQRTARGGRNVQVINVQATAGDQMDRAVEQIGELLRQRHKTAQDDFIVQSQEDLLDVANQVTGVMTILLGAIAGISLVVGGIGIMNIMLVSVTERTREIGIRKAVGATRRNILAQFLVEAIMVSVVGGGVGVASGFGISRLLAGLEFNGQRLQTVVSADSVLLAFGVSAAVGLFFGIYPASRAARLHPIEALRYE